MSESPFHIDRSPLTAEQFDEVAQVGVRGFYTDPFFVFLSPGAKKRANGLFYFFGTALKHLGAKGHLVTARDDQNRIVGVSAWIAPGGYPQPIATQLAQIPGSLRALGRRPKSLLLGNRYLNAIAKVHPKEPHWYLYLLVADPEVQRRGVGGLLLNDRLGQIDDEHVGSYLETQKEDNLAYYRRFGYELVQPVAPVPGGPPVYTLWRPAR